MAKSNKSELHKKVNRIEIYIWGKFVGAVALDPTLGFYVFAYDTKFGNSGIELSPLQMPLNNSEAPFVFTDLPIATFQRLPALLADSLPDDFGNALIEAYLAEKGISKSQITALDKLAYMGDRAMGAMEFRPSKGPKTQIPTALEMNDLVMTARGIIEGRLDDDKEINAALHTIIAVGTSAGGARAKAIVAWNPQTKEIRSGQLAAPPGFEHWLLKFDGLGEDGELGSSQDYGRIEYAYSLMAKAAGITMTECKLLEENGRAHFMTKRFDRESTNTKHHMQTLCAMSHIDYKKKSTNSYEQYFMTIRNLAIGHNAEVEAFRRMVFNVMSRNCDDHSKNFSFLLRKGSSWQLSPAYDICFAHNPKGQWTAQHLMSVNGKFKDFSLKDILTVASRFGIGEGRVVVSEVESAIRKWNTFAKTAGIHKKVASHIKDLHVFLT